MKKRPAKKRFMKKSPAKKRSMKKHPANRKGMDAKKKLRPSTRYLKDRPRIELNSHLGRFPPATNYLASLPSGRRPFRGNPGRKRWGSRRRGERLGSVRRRHNRQRPRQGQRDRRRRGRRDRRHGRSSRWRNRDNEDDVDEEDDIDEGDDVDEEDDVDEAIEVQLAEEDPAPGREEEDEDLRAHDSFVPGSNYYAKNDMSGFS